MFITPGFRLPSCIKDSKCVYLNYGPRQRERATPMYGEEMDYSLEDYFDPDTGRFVDPYEDLNEYDVYGW